MQGPQRRPLWGTGRERRRITRLPPPGTAGWRAPSPRCQHPARDVTREASGARPCRRGFRFGHTLIAVVELVGLGYVWTCALVRRRDRLLRFSVAALLAEGAARSGGETAPSDRCSAEWATPSRCSSSCSHPGRRKPPFPFSQRSPWLASPYSPSDRRCPKGSAITPSESVRDRRDDGMSLPRAVAAGLWRARKQSQRWAGPRSGEPRAEVR